MPSAFLAPVPTEQRLLLAAEELFAHQGVDGASLRSIMQAAGTNVASVHYHFGSREALLDAVVRSRLDAVSFGRDRLLEGLGDRADAPALAAAFVQPVLDLVDDGGAHWVSLIATLLRTNHPALAPVSDGFFERNSRFFALVQALDPTASPRAIGFRLAQAMTLTLNTMGNLDNVGAVLSREGTAWDADAIRTELLDVVAAILSGPPLP